MGVWINTMNYGLSVLKKCLVLTFLLTGTAYSEPQANKPYKVCPEVVTAKDTPCKVAKPTATVAVRLMEAPKTDLEKENKHLRELVDRLINKIKELEEQNVPISNN